MMTGKNLKKSPVKATKKRGSGSPVKPRDSHGRIQTITAMFARQTAKTEAEKCEDAENDVLIIEPEQSPYFSGRKAEKKSSGKDENVTSPSHETVPSTATCGNQTRRLSLRSRLKHPKTSQIVENAGHEQTGESVNACEDFVTESKVTTVTKRKAPGDSQYRHGKCLKTEKTDDEGEVKQNSDHFSGCHGNTKDDNLKERMETCKDDCVNESSARINQFPDHSSVTDTPQNSQVSVHCSIADTPQSIQSSCGSHGNLNGDRSESPSLLHSIDKSYAQANTMHSVTENILTVTQTDRIQRHISTSSVGVSEPDNKFPHTNNSSFTNSQSSVDSAATYEGEGGAEIETDDAYQTPYYLENFLIILETVLNHEHDRLLFNEEDMKTIQTFYDLTDEGKKLYIRLFQRKLRWLRNGKIDYPKIAADLTNTLKELVTVEFLDREDKMGELVEVLETLTAPDLRNLAKSLRINVSNLQQPKIVQAVLVHSRQKTIGTLFSGNAGNTANMIYKRAKALLGDCYRVTLEKRNVFIRVMMLFSLTRTRGDQDERATGQQQLFQMLMSAIGRVVYPNYTLNRQTQLFPHRESFLRFSEALQWECDMADALDCSDFDGAIKIYEKNKENFETTIQNAEEQSHLESLPVFLRSYTAGALYARILAQAVEVLQKQRKYGEAVKLLEQLLNQQLYCQDSRGSWYDRLALNLDFHLKKPAQALKMIASALSDAEVRVGHRLSLFQRAEKICSSSSNKHLRKIWWNKFKNDPMASIKEAPKVTVQGKQVHLSTGPSWVYIDPDTHDKTFCSVEQYAIIHYRDQGFDEGFHCEGGVFAFLFALYLWDEIFLSEGMEDVFQNAFQTGPLDLDTDHFYQSRQEALDLKLDTIKKASVEELQTMLAISWEEHQGTLCLGVNWELFSCVEQAQGLVACIGGAALSGILGRLAKCHRFCRSGMPDLVMWNTSNNTCKLVEVKGPGDHLSTKQILWLDFLLTLGVDSEVCLVSAVGSRRLR